MQVDLPIFGDFSSQQNVAFDSSDLVNLFLIKGKTGKKQFAFLNSPGLLKVQDIAEGSSPSRQLYTFENTMYGTFGSEIYSFPSNLVKNFIGSIGTSRGYISTTANNAGQVIFVDGQSGYIYNTNTASFSKITSTGFPANPLNVAYLDGYFVVPVGNSDQFQISSLNDGTTWSALDFARVQAAPGNNVGVGVVNRRLFFFKDLSTEVWFNAGARDFPFRRDNNLIFNYGCLTASSIVSAGLRETGFGILFWLSRHEDGVGPVMMTSGQEAKRISTDDIDDLIASFKNPADMSAYVYEDNGHVFYVMSFNTDDKTLVYDLKMDTWQRYEMIKHLATNDNPDAGKTRHLSNCHAYFNNVHYVGSYKSPSLYIMSRDYSNNDGEPIRRVRTCSHFFDKNYKRIQINSIQVDLQMGLGGASFNSSQPQIYLRISRDGGESFGNYHPASLGAIGDRTARAIFRNLGVARDIVPQLIINADVKPIAILGASINYDGLSA